MNYKQWLVPKLKRLPLMRKSANTIPEEIVTLKLELSAIKASTSDGVRVSGGGDNRTEEKIIANIAEREQLERNLEIAQREIATIESALEELDRVERRVLEAFYVDTEPRPVDALMEELGYEKSQIYRIKDKALIDLGVALFGIAEA